MDSSLSFLVLYFKYKSDLSTDLLRVAKNVLIPTTHLHLFYITNELNDHWKIDLSQADFPTLTTNLNKFQFSSSPNLELHLYGDQSEQNSERNEFILGLWFRNRKLCVTEGNCPISILNLVFFNCRICEMIEWSELMLCYVMNPNPLDQKRHAVCLSLPLAEWQSENRFALV